MDHYYLHGTYDTTAPGSSFFLPLGVELAEAPTLSAVSCSTPGISVDTVAPSATGLSILVSPSVPAGTAFTWMVTTAASILAMFNASLVSFDELDEASAVLSDDESLLVRAGSPLRYAFGSYSENMFTGVMASGVATITEGAEEVSVVFGDTFAGGLPSVAVTPMHTGTPPELVSGTVTALSRYGFTYSLAAEAPAGASILWTAVRASLPSLSGDSSLWVENEDGSITPV